jgi:hypothetical protein
MVDQDNRTIALQPYLSPFQSHPASVGLKGLVELLTVVPLDVNPTLRKVISLPMPLEEIVSGRGEIFEIQYTVA